MLERLLLVFLCGFSSPLLASVRIGGPTFDQTISQKRQLWPLWEQEGKVTPYPGEVRYEALTPTIAVSKSGTVTPLAVGAAEVRMLTADGQATLAWEIADGPIRIYVQAPELDWATPRIWYWYLGGNADVTGRDPQGQPLPAVIDEELGGWPGPPMAATDWSGWVSYDVPRFHQGPFVTKGLVPQPARMVFNNGYGQKSRDFIHYEGCFEAYDRFLDPEQGMIDGRWISPADCERFPSDSLISIAPHGGPLFEEDAKIEVRIPLGPQVVAARLTHPFEADIRDEGIFVSKAELLEQDQVCAELTPLDGEPFSYCVSFFSAEKPVVNTLGAQYQAAHTTFSIWSPDRKDVRLWLDGQIYPMGFIEKTESGYQDIYAVKIAGNHHLKPYHFLIDGQVVRDPYGVMVEPGTDYNLVMDLRQTKVAIAPPPPLDHLSEAIVYELNIRDFTIHESSGVSPALRGTFSGAVEPDTWLNGDPEEEMTTGLAHLKELGVTHVQIMPAYDYATCSLKDERAGPDCYNWGYDPENYNIPEERYAAKPDQPVERMKEFKRMVDGFHKAGIRVIMDVVYNHTWTRPFRESDEGERVFSQITSRYFLSDDQGRGYDLTGTGNTINGREPMVQRFIKDSLHYWVREYQVDGFRFDLAGVFPKDTVADWAHDLYQSFPDRKLLLYGEPWTAHRDPNEDHFRLHHLRDMKRDGAYVFFGGFADGLRNAVKGNNNDGGGGGFAFNQGFASVVANGLKGSLGSGAPHKGLFAAEPFHSINYVSSHDNLTLWDKILAFGAREGVSDEGYLKRIHKFASSIPLVAQGIPMIHSGAEWHRSKGGSFDSYNLPDQINALNWNQKREQRATFQFIRNLVQLRRKISSFTLSSGEDIYQRMSIVERTDQFISARIRGQGEEPSVWIYLNAGPSQTRPVPHGRWRFVAGDGEVSEWERAKIVQGGGSINIAGTSLTLLVEE